MLRVVTPCQVPWSSMDGDDQVRFCGRCRKNVYNVAAMTAEEALAVVDRGEGRACMMLARRADGTVVTGGCRAALRRARRRGLLAFALALPVVLVGQLSAQWFGWRMLTLLVKSGSLLADSPTTGLGQMPRLPESAPPREVPAVEDVFPGGVELAGEASADDLPRRR